MQTVSGIDQLRQLVHTWRKSNDRIAFVPTMGNLHAGHLKLVEQARQNADRVIVSIYVNPMQFGEGEDLDSYPRTLQQDSEQLQKHDVDGLFTPSDELIYPQGIQQSTYVDVPGLTDILEGAHRPGHFRGVTTVVMKLFSIVQPDVALFGQKDYQQLKVIEKMVADLFLPIELMAVATQREQSGLALSSRNSYLDDVERDKAAYIYKVLEHTSVRLQKGEQNFVKLQNQAKEMLVNAGFKPDYVEIRNAENLEVPHNHPDKMVILAAVYLDSIRLIDNLLIFL